MMSLHNNSSDLLSPSQLLAERWGSGQQVDLAEFVKGFSDLPSSSLVTIVLVDQFEQWKIGNFIVAEEYFNRFPLIKTDKSAAVDLIYREYLLREHYHRVQSDDEFMQRFPEFAEELSLQLQIHRLVDNQPLVSESDTRPQLQLLSTDITPVDDSMQIAWRREASKRINDRLPEISGYQLIELVGQGGMGAVYRGWHNKLNRQVALKVVRSTLWSDPTSRERFEAEARATARLNHPNIVQIYEVGEIDQQLFFSIEYCRGGSLNEWLGGTPVPARLAAETSLPICLAVQHAHQRGIIHRDLKPANIVVQFSEDRPVERISANLAFAIPKVTDFGLARSNDELGKTRADALLGTPSYMSPEQARATKDVNHLSDVYSLGAILYEMLTGRPPFKGASVMETVRQVISDEPVPPIRFNPNLPRDLQTICLKALQKEPGKRYASAQEFAEDLQRYLDGVPVKARPVSAMERSYRWARRNPGWSSAIASLLVMFAVAWQLTMINISQTRASLGELRDEQKKTLEEQKRAEEALSQAEKGLYLASITQANTAWNSLSMSSMKSFVDQCPPKLRCWEWGYLSGLNNRRDEIWYDESRPIASMAWDPINQHLATANFEGQISVYQVTNSQPIEKHQLEPLLRLKLAFLNDGDKLLYVEGTTSDRGLSRKSRVAMIDWRDPDTKPFRWNPDKPYGISDLAVCAERNQFAVALLNADSPTLPGVLKIFSSDSSPPTEVATMSMPSVGCRFITFSADGSRLAIFGGDRSIYIIDAKSLEVLETFEALNYGPRSDDSSFANVSLFGKIYSSVEWGVDRVNFSSDGKLLAAGMYHGVVKIWDLATNKLLVVLQSEDDHLSQLLISKDNKRLAVMPISSAVIHLYDLETGREFAAHQGHQSRISGIAFLDDGDIFTTGYDGSIRRWGGSDRSNNYVLAGHSQSVLGVAFHPNGKLLATGDGDIFKARSRSKIRFWDLESRQCQRQIDIDYSVGAMRYDAKGERLAVACADNVVRIFSGSMEAPQALKGHSSSVTSLDWNPKKNELASVSGSLFLAMLPGEAVIWDTEKMLKRHKLVGHTAALSSVAYSPDGHLLATGSVDKTVKVWDPETGQCLRTLKGPKNPVLCVVYDPNGRWIAAGSGDIWDSLNPKPGAIHIWSTSTWELQQVLRGHSQLVHGLSVTSDGKRLISCARNDKIRLWDPETGIEMLTLSPSDYACGVCFSSNGQYLAVPNWSGRVDLYSAVPIVSNPETHYPTETPRAE